MARQPTALDKGMEALTDLLSHDPDVLIGEITEEGREGDLITPEAYEALRELPGEVERLRGELKECREWNGEAYKREMRAARKKAGLDAGTATDAVARSPGDAQGKVTPTGGS